MAVFKLAGGVAVSMPSTAFVPPPLSPVPDPILVLCERMARRIIEDQHLSGFSDQELEDVILRAKQVLSPEPALLQLTAPFVVFGDVHGQLNDLIRFLMIVGHPPKTRLLFLGDYVDRCKKSLEVIVLLFAYKCLYPEDVFLLRGNHECSKINRLYGFHKEMKLKRNAFLWGKFNEAFNELPLCAVISQRILCMHGGLSPTAMTWKELKALRKPKTPKECEEGPELDLLWSDPIYDPCCGSKGFRNNRNRGISLQFDETAVARACDALDIDFVCRAHEVAPKGHAWAFGERLVTIFSAPNYCGADGNAASVMHVTRKLQVSFTTLRPRMEKAQPLTEEHQRLLKKMEEMQAAHTPRPSLHGHEDFLKNSAPAAEQPKPTDSRLGVAVAPEKKKTAD